MLYIIEYKIALLSKKHAKIFYIIDKYTKLSFIRENPDAEQLFNSLFEK